MTIPASWRVTVRVDDYELAREIHDAIAARDDDFPGTRFRVLKFEALTADGEPVIDDFDP